MKNISTYPLALVLLAGTLTAVQAGPYTSEREARTAKIEALYMAVRSGRLSRSDMIQAKLDIARLEAEARKEQRQQDRMRDRAAAQNSY
ncbi:MAG: hypothetical protein R3E95_23660 [Thiolinea sp.]